MKKTYNKLVRDYILNHIISDDKFATFKILDEKEYKTKLKEKLLEEVSEYLESESVEELADIEEVLKAIRKVNKISKYKINKIRKAKARRNGAFKSRILLLNVVDDITEVKVEEMLEDSFLAFSHTKAERDDANEER